MVYVGGFGSAPLRTYDLDKASGALTARADLLDAGPAPSCLALNPARTHLYIGNEDDGPGGGIRSYAIAADGSLRFVNQRSGDGGFTALEVSPDGKWVAAASYSGGSASLFALGEDGAIGALAGASDFGGGALAFLITEQASTVIPYRISVAGTLSAGRAVSSFAGGLVRRQHRRSRRALRRRTENSRLSAHPSRRVKIPRPC